MPKEGKVLTLPIFLTLKNIFKNTEELIQCLRLI